jgi:cation transport ATPase
LQTATVGVAFGVQSDITSEAADAVILETSLGRVDELIHIARRMRRIALQSAVGGMALSILGMFAAAFGYLPPIGGAIAQEIIDLAAVLNAVRVAVPPRFLTDFYSDYQQEKQQRCLCYRLWKALRRLNKDGNVYT